MKAFFEDTARMAINPKHRLDCHLDGQMVVIDCAEKEEVLRLDLYKKGQKTYFCCLWNSRNTVYVTGSGTGSTRFAAVYTALKSAGISFDEDLPEIGNDYDRHVWDKLERFAVAIAQASGVEDYYIHNCLRSN